MSYFKAKMLDEGEKMGRCQVGQRPEYRKVKFMHNRLADNCTSTTLYGSHSSNTSFIGSLVQANLQPLMQELTDIDTFLESLRPAISRIAFNLSYGYQSRDTETDDLVQEGMIAAWKASSVQVSGSLKTYCLTSARHAMVKYLERHDRLKATCLEPEQWLTVPAATETPTPATFTRKRKTVLSMLRTLSKRERLVTMAHFGMTSTNNRVCLTRQAVQERHHLTNTAYSNARRNAIKKLASMTCPC